MSSSFIFSILRQRHYFIKKEYLLNLSLETVSNPCAKLEIAGALDIIGVERPGQRKQECTVRKET
jgi:hypothetical protein